MKRRKRRARQARRRNAFRVIVVAGVVTALCVAAFGSKKPEQVEERQQETTQEETTHAETVQNPETIVQTAEEIESKYKVFDTMSEDWGSCDLEGFVYYDLPEQEHSDLGDDRIRMELELMGVTLEESGWRSYEDEPVNLSVLVNSENPFRVRVAETVVRYLGY